MTRPKWAGTQNSQNCLAYLKEEVLRQGFRSPLSVEGIKTLSWRSLFMLEANVLDKVSPGNRGRHFFGACLC
jgi:hypothetical protein